MAEKSLLDHELRWARAMKAVADDNRHLEEIALQFKAKFYSSPRLDQFFLRGVTNHEGRLQFGAGIEIAPICPDTSPRDPETCASPVIPGRARKRLG